MCTNFLCINFGVKLNPFSGIEHFTSLIFSFMEQRTESLLAVGITHVIVKEAARA